MNEISLFNNFAISGLTQTGVFCITKMSTFTPFGKEIKAKVSCFKHHPFREYRTYLQKYTKMPFCLSQSLSFTPYTEKSSHTAFIYVVFLLKRLMRWRSRYRAYLFIHLSACNKQTKKNVYSRVNGPWSNAHAGQWYLSMSEAWNSSIPTQLKRTQIYNDFEL